MTAEKQLQQAKEIDFEVRCGLRELKYWKDLKQKMADAGITSANSHTVLSKKIDRIAERLSELKVPFAKLDTDESIEKWNRSEIPVALIHPASAGHGLNLQSGGSTLVWFGITWSLELYQQTVARLWRQGQKQTVVVQHIITKNTIDENIMAALEKKEHTQSALIDAVKANIINFGGI